MEKAQEIGKGSGKKEGILVRIILLIAVLTLFILISSMMSFSFYKDSINEYSKSSFISQDNQTTKIFELKKQTKNRFNQNYMFFSEEISEINSSQLMQEYPKIRMIAYFDEQSHKRIYHLKIGDKFFGREFTLRPNVTYELFAKENMNINFDVK